MKAKHALSPRPFGLRDKIGYLLGDFGNDFTFILSSSFLLKFYTDVMGVSAGIVGLVMMFARFVDAFTDVTMGRICDKSKITRVGKFKPWLRRMCAPVAISSFLMYQSALADRPMWFKVAWLVVTYLLWGSIFYTTVNIPYGSMASAISADPSDRQSLSTYRSMGATLAGVIIGAGIPMLVYKKEIVNGVPQSVMQGRAFTLVAGVFSLFAVGAYLLCYYLTTERVTPAVHPEKQKGNSIGKLLQNAFKNRALLSIIVASIVMLLAQLTMQQMANYVFPNYYNQPEAQTVSTLAMMIGMLIAAGIAKPLSTKYGKAEISVASNLLAGASCLALFLLRPQNVWFFVALQFVCWFGLGVFSMVSWALITDVIDYSELKNGIREDGSIYALYSFARKLGQAGSSGLVGLLLTLIGYSESTAFNPSVLSGIYTIATLLPAIGFILLALVLWFWYPLHKKQVDKNVKKLQKLHKAAQTAEANPASDAANGIEEGIIQERKHKNKK